MTGRDGQAKSLFALVWEMLARLAAMLLLPGKARSAVSLLADAEEMLIRALFQRAIESDPGLAGENLSDWDVRFVWTRFGNLKLHIARKADADEARRERIAYLEHLCGLRRMALRKAMLVRFIRLRNTRRFTLLVHRVRAGERRRIARRYMGVAMRARTAAPPPPLLLVPP